VNRFSDRRISQKKFGFRSWRIFYMDLRILLIQRIADLSNILSRIVDLAYNRRICIPLFTPPPLEGIICTFSKL
jgi:hypothetical protein